MRDWLGAWLRRVWERRTLLVLLGLYKIGEDRILTWTNQGIDTIVGDHSLVASALAWIPWLTWLAIPLVIAYVLLSAYRDTRPATPERVNPQAAAAPRELVDTSPRQFIGVPTEEWAASLAGKNALEISEVEHRYRGRWLTVPSQEIRDAVKEGDAYVAPLPVAPSWGVFFEGVFRSPDQIDQLFSPRTPGPEPTYVDGCVNSLSRRATGGVSIRLDPAEFRPLDSGQSSSAAISSQVQT